MCFCASFLDVRVGNLLGFFLILDSDCPEWSSRMCCCASFLDGDSNIRAGNPLGCFLILDVDRPCVIQQNTGCLDSGSNIRVGNPAGCLLILDSGQPFNDWADCVAVLDSNIRVENQARCFLIVGVWTVIVIAPEWFSKMPCHAGFSDSDSTHRSGQAYQ